MTTIAASWLDWAEPRLFTDDRNIAVLLIGAGIFALTLAVPAVKRGGRTLVTVVHEAGHAVVAEPPVERAVPPAADVETRTTALPKRAPRKDAGGGAA